MKNLVTVGKARRKNVMYVRRQLVSWGWRRAQERFLMAGWADDVMGLIERTVLGRVTVVGKRIGEMNALLYVRIVSVSTRGWRNLRPLESRYLSEIVNNSVGVWPWQAFG